MSRKMVPPGTAVFLVIIIGVSMLLIDSGLADSGKIIHAVVESCRGCQLNRLPDVKAFINEDLPQYENTEFKHIQGAPPELIFYNENEEELERIKLAQLTREECNELLKKKDFKRKGASVKDEI
ncbi:hypothetical protein QAD02_015756 [Eretmocerus hayati]|uniref:Uncharacterized protein n=1 Tax=Eretmocerus hayati TaxID=131215 RepID=A0ACC2PBK3_9HYME|nr:hypothetical protein QAD02_015756 [Eretmocerus hayati]